MTTVGYIVAAVAAVVAFVVGFPIGIQSVSYTHLDVYKRQAWWC